MKRWLLPAAAAVALLVPAHAGAALKKYTSQGHVISFRAHVKDGRAKRILGDPDTATGLTITGVPMHCDDGNHKTGVVLAYDIPVAHQAFSTDSGDGSGTFHVDGAFEHHARKAKGSLKLKGTLWATDDYAFHDGCGTGSVDWRAHRV